MATNGFSSLKNFDNLKEAGFSENQAWAILKMMGQDSASKQDLEHATAELKREIADIKREIADIKREIADVKREIADVQKYIKELDKNLDTKMNYKMAAASAGIVLTILTCLVTLGKLGLLTPTPTP